MLLGKTCFIAARENYIKVVKYRSYSLTYSPPVALENTVVMKHTLGNILCPIFCTHYKYVIMSTMASQITNASIVYSGVCSGADQRKHQSSASLAFIGGIHRRPVYSPNKGPLTWKMFPFDDVIRGKWEYFIGRLGIMWQHCSCFCIICDYYALWLIVMLNTQLLLQSMMIFNRISCVSKRLSLMALATFRWL